MKNNLKKSTSIFTIILPSLALIACSQATDSPALSASNTANAATTNALAHSQNGSQAQKSNQENSYLPQGLLAKSLPEIATALRKGDTTSEALVKAYLERIENVDHAGPTLQSVLSINPDALSQARALDKKRADGEELGPLHGVPVLLKDNIETLDNVATTAGAYALKDNITGRDSPLSAGLREAGAIIIGKTNLSQWANFRSNNSISGWTALGGQVRNPHMLDRSPCGSSSGSGAAAAASLAAGTVGTETNGSIICPSNVNGIVGFKPTVGLVSQQYIVPISSSQDTAGPMTKTVKGAAMMLEAMATGDAKTNYVSTLDANSLNGLRIGVMRFSVGNNQDIIGKFDKSLAVLEEAGAILVEIDEFELQEENYGTYSRDVLNYEFKTTIDEYLENAAPQVKTRNLDQLIEFNLANKEVELALFDQSIFDAAAKLGPLSDPAYIKARDAVQSATREKGIDALLAKHNVTVLVSPSGPLSSRVDPINGDTWPAWSGAGYLAAVAGYPHITVPMGTVHGIPLGFSIMGAKDTDADILSYGYAFEQKTNLRAEPQYHKDAEGRSEIAKAMRRK